MVIFPGTIYVASFLQFDHVNSSQCGFCSFHSLSDYLLSSFYLSVKMSS